MAIDDVTINSLQGEPLDLGGLAKDKAVLVVNVASKCGLTPQYTGVEKLHEELSGRGFTVLGVPCNQFGGQEPGSADEIETFCSTTYGVTFPMMEKVDVNGPGRHEIYKALAPLPDGSGHSGDIRWNFEKFVVSADGTTITRFDPKTKPDDPAVVAAIESGLPKQ